MMLRTKICLALAVVFLFSGFVMSWGPYSHQIPPSLHVVFPVGAIFLGLFLISKLFSKEDRIYGEDQQRAAGKAGVETKAPPAERI